MNINLETPLGNSEIIFQRNGVQKVRDELRKKHPSSRFIIVTDSNIRKIHEKLLSSVFLGGLILEIDSGESSKMLGTVERLAGQMLEEGVTRADVLIGFGGGMVTDLAGFLASIYMRGMPYSAIPTSLLGMVDAAIGGKTGVDTTAKNILGTFYPAEMILIDADLLEELPPRQFQIGMAEIIKYAATLDRSLMEDLNADRLDMDKILKKSVQAKVDIVKKDVSEHGVRKVLNFGHTFGHAVEQLSNYSLSHGEAISIGMMLANKVAGKLGKQAPDTAEEIEKLLKKFSLPTIMPDNIAPRDLIDAMKKDKKRLGDKISFIITPKIGKYEVVELSAEELEKLAFE